MFNSLLFSKGKFLVIYSSFFFLIWPFSSFDSVISVIFSWFFIISKRFIPPSIKCVAVPLEQDFLFKTFEFQRLHEWIISCVFFSTYVSTYSQNINITEAFFSWLVYLFLASYIKLSRFLLCFLHPFLASS